MAARHGRNGDAGASAPSLGARVVRTARIAEARGFCFHHEDLAPLLVQGPAEPGAVARAAEREPSLNLVDGFVSLRGREALVAHSRRRRNRDPAAVARAETTATEFARRLAADCPLVECVALAGSHATGAGLEGDDVDVNVFCGDGAKFIAYALALMHASRFSLSPSASRGMAERVGPLPKVVCVNTVFERSQTSPFARRDDQLAFELLISRPVLGAERFSEVVETNPWLLELFPQIAMRPPSGSQDGGSSPPHTALGRSMASLNGSRSVLNALGYWLASAAHLAVDFTRRGDPVAAGRIRRLRRMKHPYDVLDKVENRRW
jgi:hypothetical protein